MGNPIYALTLLGIFLAAVILHKKYQLKIFKNSRHMWMYIGVIFVTGSIWDYISVTLGIWEFPLKGTIGVRIGVLPIEEFFFFLVVPYYGVVMLKFLEKKNSF